jgi:hypothetical protein
MWILPEGSDAFVLPFERVRRSTMTKACSGCAALLLMLIGANLPGSAQEQKFLPEENFYTKSLHYTNKGIEFLYSKEQGGIERITGKTAAEMGCVKSNCHVKSCDVCHSKETDGKLSYSIDQARSEVSCQRCHPVGKDDPDVHFRKGMKCMDCHSLREIHGDGIAYNTYMQPGAMDARCGTCHVGIKGSMSHTVHKGKVDCTACHVRDLPTCYNCHLETRMKENKETSIPLKDMLFLVNHDGTVTAANFLSYVYENKTMITFAPSFPHSIKKEGRKCGECHGTQIVRDIADSKFRLVQWKNGKIENMKGVIPVVDGMKWDLVYLDKENGKWVPLKDPEGPLLNYSGYCSPLTQQQFDQLTKRRGIQ